MAKCDLCGTECALTFDVEIGASNYTFGSFECAVATFDIVTSIGSPELPMIKAIGSGEHTMSNATAPERPDSRPRETHVSAFSL